MILSSPPPKKNLKEKKIIRKNLSGKRRNGTTRDSRLKQLQEYNAYTLQSKNKEIVDEQCGNVHRMIRGE